jgi:coenzyme F420-reducing hydrogenase alpha subunit
LKKKINTAYLSRVEGEGSLTIEMRNGKVEKLDLGIFEAPRFFEPILRGRHFQDVIDFTARICGICPVAYQISAVHAIEAAMGVSVPQSIQNLRRLMYCGEWISSHALHVHFLHGPDFYNMESAWSKKDYAHIAERGTELQSIGNEILALLGGRPVHPVSVRPGGFFKVPEKRELYKLLPRLHRGFELSHQCITWAASLFEKVETTENTGGLFISLRDHNSYPMNTGTVCTSDEIAYSMDEFAKAIEEYQVSHSNALHAGIERGSKRELYTVGPLSRININFEALPEEIKSVIRHARISIPLLDMRMSIIARCIEISYALFEAMKIIEGYAGTEASLNVEPGEGKGLWITEAPRGMLIHSYEFDRNGNVEVARIIPPTSQNLAHIEKSLREYVGHNSTLSVKKLRRGSEQIIRSYDPCISCSVHVIDLSDSQR